MNHTAHAEILADRLRQALCLQRPGQEELITGLLCRLAVQPAVLNDDERAALRGVEDVEYDALGRLASLIISHQPTSCTVRLPGGKTVWTWCLFDTLMLQGILPRPFSVEQRGASFTVTDEGIRAAADPELWVSVPTAFTPGGDLRAEFCANSALHQQRPQVEEKAAYRLSEAAELGKEVARKLGWA